MFVDRYAQLLIVDVKTSFGLFDRPSLKFSDGKETTNLVKNMRLSVTAAIGRHLLMVVFNNVQL